MIDSLRALLETTASDWCVYDLGRGCTPLDNAFFARFEDGLEPYPSPLAGQAWLALLFWDDDAGEAADQRFVWFLHFGLDETGLIQLAARDHFLQLVHDKTAQLLQHAASGSDGLDAAPSADQLGAVMDDNPYAFRPRQEALACLNAAASLRLGHPPSAQYAHARRYLDGDLGFDQWQFVGLQGLVDVATRWQQDDNQQVLIKAIAHLPLEPLGALALGLENQAICEALGEALVARVLPQMSAVEVLDDEQVGICAAVLRATRACQSSALHLRLLDWLLALPSLSPALVESLASRAYAGLGDEDRAKRFLEALSRSVPDTQFAQTCAQLMVIPGLRAPMLAAMRQASRSSSLDRALAGFFSGLQS